MIQMGIFPPHDRFLELTYTITMISSSDIKAPHPDVEYSWAARVQVDRKLN
jgi:hypothetical protein